MRHLILIFCMTITTVLMTATATIALPACPSDPTKRYHNCLGTWIAPKGDKYVGEIKDGKPNGQGTVTFTDGDKYVGEFRDGEIHGHGSYTYANRDKYVGEFKDGQRHGQGVYSFADGRRNVGEYDDGILEGYAIQYRADGSILRKGIFKNGEFQRAQN